ncbi:MAG TPA: arsenate reductase ArsC [Chloroflexota bacterium]|nr:arsenate reductase ArsC [Chloroflexota bacterium]
MPTQPTPDLEAALRREIGRLAEEFHGRFGPETIALVAREAVAQMAGARVAAFLPTFVYRYTRQRLQAILRLEALGMTSERPEVLFVCVHNAGRSQMAAALTHHLSGGRVTVRSAGTAPAAAIHPEVVAAMAELGLDLSQEFPKLLTDEAVQAADVVITMGCGDACPLYPGKRYEDWPVPDPAGKPLEEVRAIRDAIRARVERLLADLGVAPAA